VSVIDLGSRIDRANNLTRVPAEGRRRRRDSPTSAIHNANRRDLQGFGQYRPEQVPTLDRSDRWPQLESRS
jgi:hypothetical protein